MSSKSSNNQSKNSTTNPHLKSSIVHKPFTTGTINIFNPHRRKSDSKLASPKLFLNAELEKDTAEAEADFTPDLELSEIEYRDRNRLDSLLSPWGISAIAILFLANLISLGVIWRNSVNVVESERIETAESKVGHANLTEREFMPLNLSTLSLIETVEEPVEDYKPSNTPISPALAPLNNLVSSINPQYYYILAEYTGEQSLSVARQKVKQISLVNLPQGVFIYLGAFKQKEQADEFISYLKQEDLITHIYPFD